MTGKRNQRRTKRIDKALDLTFSVVDEPFSLTGKVMNLSSGGVFIATEEELEKGTFIKMSFEVSQQLEDISIVGKVVWHGSRDGKKGVGVAFSVTDPITIYNLMRDVKEGGWLYALGVLGDV